MVHALREIWRVLIPGGHLIDVRPRPTNGPLEVVAPGQILLAGTVDNAPFVPDDSAAEKAMTQTVREGLFSIEHQATFDCASYWNTLDDMLTYYEESENPPLTIPDKVLTAARAFAATSNQKSRVRIRAGMHLARYRKVEPQLKR
jgi:hypothetical protein